MTLRAPPRMFSRKKKKKRKSNTGDIITGGVTALLGTALLSSTANALSRV